MLSLLKHSAEIHRPTTTQTAIGTPTKTFAVASTIDCLIQVKSVRAVDMYGKVTFQQSPVMYCIGADIENTDRVKHGDDVYRVVGIVDAAGMSHHQEIQLESIEI